MDTRARDWFIHRTWSADDFDVTSLMEAKGSTRISVVIPARDEELTVGSVVARIRQDLVRTGLVDEIVVMDSLSSDDTAKVAAEAGARVESVRDVLPEQGVRKGKGEALWKSQFVTAGDLLVFVDADLTGWDTHFVTGLIGPLLREPGVSLVKGFYERVLDQGAETGLEGGRVTELVAKPWLALNRPEMSGLLQPLAGEWSIRRSLFETLAVPVGYGVEVASLVDTVDRYGIGVVGQVDLGTRRHRHQHLHDLGAMAIELLGVLDRRLGRSTPDEAILPRMSAQGEWRDVSVSMMERPPALSTSKP